MLISVGQVEPGPRETSPAHVIFEQGRSPRVIFLQPTRTCPYPHMNQAFRRVPVGSAAQLPVRTEPGLTKMSQFDCPARRNWRRYSGGAARAPRSVANAPREKNRAAKRRGRRSAALGGALAAPWRRPGGALAARGDALLQVSRGRRRAPPRAANAPPSAANAPPGRRQGAANAPPRAANAPRRAAVAPRRPRDACNRIWPRGHWHACTGDFG